MEKGQGMMTENQFAQMGVVLSRAQVRDALGVADAELDKLREQGLLPQWRLDRRSRKGKYIKTFVARLRAGDFTPAGPAQPQGRGKSSKCRT